MDHDSLQQRGKALEDSFFREKDKQLLEKLRAEFSAQQKRDALAQASSVSDENVLDQILAAAIDAETVAAFALVPLVAVAWADEKIQGAERKAILSAAHDDGLKSDSVGHRLLESWLDEKPGDELLAAWKAYAASLSGSLGEAGVAPFRGEILGRARRVAEAAGGILGMGNKVSESESAVLDDLQQAFQ